MQTKNIIEKKVSDVINYVDLNYKGWKFNSQLSYKEILTFQITDFSAFPSISPYPLGSVFNIYPSGSAIPILQQDNRLKLKIKWGNASGLSKVCFYTVNFTEIAYSGIFIKETPFEAKEIILTIPNEAKYIVIKTESGELNLTEFALFSIISSEKESPLLVTNVEALKNIFKLWLFSSKGDYGRNIFKGGPIDTLLASPISSVGAERIKSYLLNIIRNNFVYLQDSEIIITPLPKENTYQIKIILKDDFNKYISPIELEVS